jgi:cytoskeletal protein CcmA (bactofilin family)
VGFNRKEPGKISGKIMTVIGKETFIEGHLQGSGALRIDGRVKGQVTVDGDIIVGEGAVLEAAVTGRNIEVSGRVQGNMTASGRLDIMATGAVQGDVYVQALQVADGAFFLGACTMQKQEPKP